MSAPKDEVVFDWDWLLLDKPSIEMLSYLLLSGGRFEGNITSLCRLMGSKNVNTGLRNRRTATVENLVACGAIQYTQKSATKFEVVVLAPAEEKEMVVERSLLEAFMRRDYLRSVAWQQVLRIYLWLRCKGNRVYFRREEVATIFNVSEDVITQACHVLDEHYHIIALEKDEEDIEVEGVGVITVCHGLIASFGTYYPSD